MLQRIILIKRCLKAQFRSLLISGRRGAAPAKCSLRYLKKPQPNCPKKAKAVKIDIDSQNELAEKYGVMSIPTFMIFKNGQPVQKSVGLISKEEILEIFKNAER